MYDPPVPDPQATATRRSETDRTVAAAARFRRTRAAHRDETAEDYVEAIAGLIDSRGEARVGELARHMGVSHVTVSRTVGRLVRSGLVRQAPRRPMTLTARGRAMAQRIRERHSAVVSFLVWLGVPPRQAEIDAEGIEHHVSVATIQAMRRRVASPADAAGRE